MADDLIVLLAANRWDGTRMSDWHMARQLAVHVPVLYADPPRSVLRGRQEPVREVAPGVWHMTPAVHPFPARRITAATAAALARRQLRDAVRALGIQPAAVISGWPLYPAAGACGEAVHAYWAKDDFTAGASLMGVSAALTARQERRVVRGADLVIASNPLVEQTWRRRGKRTALIPFGTDSGAAWDCPEPAVTAGSSPAAGLIGRLNARIDLSLLEAVAGRGIPLLLGGPLDRRLEPRRLAALASQPHVRLAGEIPPGQAAGCGRLAAAWSRTRTWRSTGHHAR